MSRLWPADGDPSSSDGVSMTTGTPVVEGCASSSANGATPFGELLTHPSMAGIPVVVETPSELDGSPSAGHARDIALLCSLRDGVALETSAA